MYVRFSLLRLIATITLLFLTAPMPLRGVIAESSGTLAQVSISQNRQTAADQLFDKGMQQGQMGQFLEAIQSFQQALTIYREIGQRWWERVTLNHLGDVYYELGQYQQAIDYYNQVLAIVREQGEFEWDVLKDLGDVYFSLGQYQQAFDYYEQILAIARKKYESERGSPYFDQIIFNLPRMSGIFQTEPQVYTKLELILIAQGKIEEALEIAEQSRARLFDISPEKPTAYLNINRIRQIAREHNATLVEYSIIKDDSKFDSQSDTEDSRLLIWVVKPTGEVALRQVDLKQQLPKTSLTELIVNTRESMGLAGRDPSIVAERLPTDETLQYQKLQQLYRILIEPVAELLPTEPEAQIIFIPQKDLFLVPFPALQNEQGSYLVEKQTILTAPSIQMLGLTQELKKRIRERGSANIHSDEVLVVGNPTMPPAFLDALLEGFPLSLRPLPGAEQEATVVGDFFNSKAITRNAATETNIVQRMANARIIHLAAHGLINYWGYGVSLAEDISLGAVVLAPTGSPEPVTEQSDMGINPRDGLLTSGEILGLQLQADLVVLSACNTARGRITDYGVIGLSRSFIVAGVPSVIVSLWSVPDAPTASLMTEFYRNWRERKLDKAQALRQAMLITMKSHPNPKNWAAFTLIGEAE